MLSTFGSGRLYGVRNDQANQTPTEFAVLQGVDFNFDFTTKPLFGQNQFAVFVARGEAKWTAKAKMGSISGLIFNNIFFGQTLTTGQTALSAGEAHTVPSSSPYTVQATQTTFSTDEGVSYAGNPGIALRYTTTTPVVAQYEVTSTGLYTFSSADASAAILLSYLYTTSTGENISITNQQLGTTPTFSAVFRNRDPKSGLFDTLVIGALTSSKLTLSSKTSDYTIPEFDMEVLDPGTGQIGTMSFGDLS